MQSGSDAGRRQPPATRARRKNDRPQQESAGDDEALDPDSPGATIDEPTPAEPNEPG